jgi:protoporphyrinogen oxidase
MEMTKTTVILGGGLAGLSAAYQLLDKDLLHKVIILEKMPYMGGLSRSFDFEGLRFDFGPHIYFDKDEDVTAFWRALIGDHLKSYTRNNRIFYNGKYIYSPLRVTDALIKLGPFTVIKIFWSFFMAKLKRKEVKNAEDWVTANFGQELFNRFFKVYNEKIWGLDCKEITSNWAGQRIKSSLFTMILKSIKKDKDFIIKTFNYPTGGSQAIINALQDHLNATGRCQIITNGIPEKVNLENGMVRSIRYTINGQSQEILTDNLISTIPLKDLYGLLSLDPKPTTKLIYRNLILVNCICKRETVKNFKEHWIDIHDPNVKALRVTNYGNYDFGMSNTEYTAIGLEYNCFETDAIWHMSNQEIEAVVVKDLGYMKLITDAPKKVQVIREKNAYPVYYTGYENDLAEVLKPLNEIKNLQSIGRHGMYKWNNMHHSVKTGFYAADNIMGIKRDIFSVKGMVSIGKESN